DFYTTILEMAGAEKTCNVDGRSFVPLIENTSNPSADRALVWNMPNIWGNDGPGINLWCAIRKNDWKLLYNYADGHKELYNIAHDLGESRNLADEYPELTKKLSAELSDTLRAMKAQRPMVKATGKPCPWPDEI
ncbi:MAG: sulfatase, partial [Muribaculaceae bacterium]|nr:sulfatase [Muribaculaceae bacterium]